MLFTILCLDGSSPSAAAKELGHTPKYAARVLQHLKEHGTFAEAEHNRAPSKFTPEVMAAAQQKLLDSADRALTTRDLVQLLEADGVLTPPTDRHNFLFHFRDYLSAHDLTLQVGATSTIFRITEESALERYNTAQALLDLAPNDAALQDFIFIDEIVFEESPHPKGACPRMLLGAFAGPHEH